ncbi:unnamed protein product [Brassicogethes aeneus]|uniref:Peptidase M14 domain-containing protein n=1 Tax=Brassicogethes aeneus TaxID=1431903 RepID=A0A9P0FB99_BRAAE|nr:unnamed protein product [Brassicogethes aeneus]
MSLQKMQRSLIFLLLFQIVYCSRLMHYDKYRLYRLTPRTLSAVRELRQFENKGAEIQFWTNVREINVPVDVLIPHYDAQKIEKFIRSYEVDAVLLNHDIQENINEENVGSDPLGFGWTKYYNLEEIYKWMKNLPNENPETVKLFNIGETYEKRNIFGVHISKNHSAGNKAIVIEANSNAREWITSAVTTYICNALLKSPEKHLRSFAESYDWYILPIANPDGFAYTKTIARLWRKTRTPHSLMCYGTDFNKNWNPEFSASNPCSESYQGPSSLSDNSVKNLAQFISTLRGRLAGYIAINSNAQMTTEKYKKTKKASQFSATVSFGNKYKEGNILIGIDNESQGSSSWVRNNFGNVISTIIQIRDIGRYGFLIPSSQIIPVGEKVLDIIRHLF